MSFETPPDDLLAKAAAGPVGASPPSMAPPRSSAGVVAVVGALMLLAVLGVAIAWFVLKK